MSTCGRNQDCERAAPPSTVEIKICDCECDCDCKCCIEQFYSRIKDKPKQLKEDNEKQFVHTELHEAAAAGQRILAIEIMNLMPSLGKKLDLQGLSPLHHAVVNGKTEVALALAKLDKELVLIKGKGGMTPLHYAAVQARDDPSEQLEFLAHLLAVCPHAIGVLNNRMQSAVHVALEYGNSEAAKLLVNLLVIVAKESDLSTLDAEGNTALHVAARHCHSEELLKLLSKLVKANKENKYGDTPRDIAVHCGNHVAIDVLVKAGYMKRPKRDEQQPPSRKQHKQPKMVKYLLEKTANNWPEMLTRFYYFIVKELTMEMRNAILVVAVLISTATYQGVLQPPGGVYSAEGISTAVGRFTARRLDGVGQKHPPGRMVMGTTKYSYFMPTNTLAFMSSTLVIIFVLPSRAFILILQACIIFMCVSYLLALNFISNYNNFAKALDILCGCILGVAFMLKLAYYLMKAYYSKEEEWLLRRISVFVNNFKYKFKWKDPTKTDDKKRSGKGSTMMRRMRSQYKLISKAGRPA